MLAGEKERGGARTELLRCSGMRRGAWVLRSMTQPTWQGTQPSASPQPWDQEESVLSRLRTRRYWRHDKGDRQEVHDEVGEFRTANTVQLSSSST